VLNHEVKVMLHLSPDYDILTNLQKIEIFRAALSKMKGDDIARVMWHQSGDSETWLERRTQ
jgi:FKBP12-rapamycin complex-associated protein